MKNQISNFYIHIPFCASKCSYCNFSTIISKDKTVQEKYTEAVLEELKSFQSISQMENLRTLYFGGGTPSLLDSSLLSQILDSVPGLSPKTEVLLEVNPQDLSPENLKKWKEIGITKISIGVQTFQKKFNKFLEREHFDLPKKILLAKSFFPNLSIDLIFGFPGQILDDLKKDLDQIQKLDPKHISFYALDYKKNSKIEKQKSFAKSISEINEFYLEIFKNLEKQGYEHYETYNFAKEKNYSIHNLNFWNGKDYLGFGLSAVSTVGNEIYENTKNLKTYLDQKDFKKLEKLSDFERDFLLLQRGFRLISGVSTDFILTNFGKEVLQKTLNSSFTKKLKDNKVAIRQDKMMFFEDFFQEMFS